MFERVLVTTFRKIKIKEKKMGVMKLNNLDAPHPRNRINCFNLDKL